MIFSNRNNLAWNKSCLKGSRQVYKALRGIQFEMSIFNLSNAHIIFGIKTAIIATDIVCGFAAIQLFHVSHVLSAVNVLIMLDTMCVFVVTYDKGFSIPRRVAQLKSALRMKLRQAQLLRMPGGETEKMLRQIKSIGRVAIRVGHFHHLQRTSTLSFMDFCIKNVLRLVIAYRKNFMG